MSKRKADDISNDVSPIPSPGVIETVPVRSREKRRAIRRVASTTSATQDQSSTKAEEEEPNRIVTSEVPDVITVVVKHASTKEEFSKKEREMLDASFGKLMFTLGTYYHRGFSDFKLSAINELYKSNGDPFTVDTLKIIQYIVPELFTIYLNHNQEVCVNICHDFVMIKSSIVTMWKKRLVTMDKPQSLETPVETRSLNIPTKKSLPSIDNSKSDIKIEQPKKSIQEMLRENDKREEEELERAKVLSKRFEIDRVLETLLVMFTLMKMKKKTKMDSNSLVNELKNRYTKETTVSELKLHLDLLCKHAPTLFTEKTFGSLKVFEMSSVAKFDNAKKILEESMNQ